MTILPDAHPRSAFSLVELSIVIAILAIVSVMGLEAAATFINRTAYRITKDKIAEVDTAVQQFFKVYGRLPCPAVRTLALVGSSASTSYGLEDCSITAFTGTNVLGGAVPFRTLNLPLNSSIDAYESKLQYNVTVGMTVAATFAATSDAISIRTGKLQEPCSTVCQQTTTAAYAIFSYGADKRGAVSKNGQTAVSCVPSPTGAFDGRIDSQNCNITSGQIFSPLKDFAGGNLTTGSTAIPNNVFYDSTYNVGNQEANYTDDVFSNSYHPKSQL